MNKINEKAYVSIPELNLRNLIKRDFRKLFEKREKIRKNWIKEEKCNCAKNSDFKLGKRKIMCSHIKPILRKKTKKIRKKINKKSNILRSRNLLKVLVKENEKQE